MIRWSLYGLVYDRRNVTDEMVEEAGRLLQDRQAGRAWSSVQKSEVGWGGLRTDFSDWLRGLEMPTLLVHGAQDRAVPVAWARRAQERIPDCELRVFCECGHLPPREHSEEFARVVERFLARLSSRAGSECVTLSENPAYSGNGSVNPREPVLCITLQMDF